VLAFCRTGTDDADYRPAEEQQHSHEHVVEWGDRQTLSDVTE
jgi:hypothetical protein